MESKYTAEQIRKIAPNYRGKPENFDPEKSKNPKAPQKQQQRRAGPASPLPTPPTNLDKAKTPTPPKNNPMWADSVFGIDVQVRELKVNEEHSPTLARIDSVVNEVYSSLAADDTALNKTISRNMLMYYSTAAAWARLLDIKQKRAQNHLSEEERSFVKAMTQHELNLPQPIYLMLKGIGHVKEASGKTVFLHDHTLPIEVVGGKGGYHSKTINEESHNLFEEVPCLGILGDILMAEAGQQEVPNFPVLPTRTKATQNLVGYQGRVPKAKEEIVITLESLGIHQTAFKEVIPKTRLNLQLVQRVSDYFVGSKTFRNEKVKIDALTADGDASQLIRSVPSTTENTDPLARWTDLVIKPYSANANAVSTIGATYFTGYALMKEEIAATHTNWCCVTKDSADSPWVIPPTWIANRNARRSLPEGMTIQRFAALSDSQANRTNAIVRRLIIAPR